MSRLNLIVTLTLGSAIAWFLFVSAQSPPTDRQFDWSGLDGGQAELSARIISTRDPNLRTADIFDYDFGRVDRIEKRLTGVSRTTTLKDLFRYAAAGTQAANHEEAWQDILAFISRSIRHQPLTQPMYPDKKMITDPLVLLLLQEGRCGQVARLIVDIAHANGYRARLIQLAAHLVAEVEWEGRWHWIDADADIPIEQIREVFGGLPSIADLLSRPYDLDRLAFRGWKWAPPFSRTREGAMLLPAQWYPGYLLPSSAYFGNEILMHQFDPSLQPARENVLLYYYKQGPPEAWESDRFYGWDNLKEERQRIPTVPVEYEPLPIELSAPRIVYAHGGWAEIKVRWTPAGRTVCKRAHVFQCSATKKGISYEVRVASQSRGWDYDYRNYAFMPRRNAGDILVTRAVRFYDDSTVGIDLQIPARSDVFIEVIPMVVTMRERRPFFWPSAEKAVRIFPEEGPIDHSAHRLADG